MGPIPPKTPEKLILLQTRERNKADWRGPERDSDKWARRRSRSRTGRRGWPSSSLPLNLGPAGRKKPQKLAQNAAIDGDGGGGFGDGRVRQMATVGPALRTQTLSRHRVRTNGRFGKSRARVRCFEDFGFGRGVGADAVAAAGAQTAEAFALANRREVVDRFGR